jgi:hypothetical protein
MRIGRPRSRFHRDRLDVLGLADVAGFAATHTRFHRGSASLYWKCMSATIGNGGARHDLREADGRSSRYVQRTMSAPAAASA